MYETKFISSTRASGISDEKLEALWDELEDVLVDEDEDGTMVLVFPWNGFEAGTDVESIWYWFDELHSKGVGWLMNDYKKSEVR